MSTRLKDKVIANIKKRIRRFRKSPADKAALEEMLAIRTGSPAGKAAAEHLAKAQADGRRRKKQADSWYLAPAGPGFSKSSKKS